MIGYKLKGKDVNGLKCEGIVLDKLITPQVVQMGKGSAAFGGDRQQLPMPLTSYLVLNQETGSLHIVAPMGIDAVGIPTKDGPVETGAVKKNELIYNR